MREMSNTRDYFVFYSRKRSKTSLVLDENIYQDFVQMKILDYYSQQFCQIFLYGRKLQK